MSSIPTTQKAFFVEGYPGPLTVRDRPVPQALGDDEILVKIIACEYCVYFAVKVYDGSHTRSCVLAAINPVDTRIHNLGFGFVKLFPRAPAQEQSLVLGEDLAGDVVAIGSTVTEFEVGDKV